MHRTGSPEARALAAGGGAVTLHGVFLEILGVGMLVSGDSGAGKSELALELVQRGHRLVADDAPEFRRLAGGAVEGRCPVPLGDFLEVRGLGVINVRAMYGKRAVTPRAELELILRLRAATPADAAAERLRPCRDSVAILGVQVPRITLPVLPGRNLAILAEAAVRGHQLARGGYDAAADFIQRQRRLLQRDESCG